jgi:hypothetical protein
MRRAWPCNWAGAPDPARPPGRLCHPVSGRRSVAGRTTIEERLGTLEVRVDNLETWAGPGQAQALAEGQRELRADLAEVLRRLPAPPAGA